jgi:parallel beta-helix repeat protein
MRIIDRATGAIVGILALFVIALLTGVVNAGPLDPTSTPGSTPGVRLPGTPVSTLPITIDTPGHYYLTNDVTGVAAAHGITIDVGDVSIDLNGFTMTGPAGSFNGIFVNTPSQNVTVRNGSVVDWDGIGIEISNARDAVIEDVHVSGSGGVGIVTEIGTRISRCSVTQNGNSGIVTGDQNIISDCTTTENGGVGLVAGDQSVITDVTATGNAHGIDAGANVRVTNCVASENNGFGVRVLSNSVVDGCTAAGNGAGDGIEGADVSVVIRNSTSTSNNGHGISILDASIVENSAVDENALSGIRAPNGGVIRGNTARRNSAHGISVGSNALVEDNLADSNGLATGSGIFVESNGNHIERNLATGNDKGFEVLGGFNTVIGNTARGNGAAGVTDEFVLPITTVGVVVPLDGTTVDSATNPYANFSP